MRLIIATRVELRTTKLLKERYRLDTKPKEQEPINQTSSELKSIVKFKEPTVWEMRRRTVD